MTNVTLLFTTFYVITRLWSASVFTMVNNQLLHLYISTLFLTLLHHRNHMTTNKTFSGHGLWDILHVTWSHLFQRQQLVHRFLHSWYSRLNDFEPSAWHQWVRRFNPLPATLSMFEKLPLETSSSFGSFLSWPRLLSLSSLESITCKIIAITILNFSLKSKLNQPFNKLHSQEWW